MMMMCLILVSTAEQNTEEVNVDMHDIRKSSDLPLSEEEILEMIENNTPSIDPKDFEDRKSDPNTLAVYGVLSEKSGIESYDWHLTLLKIAKCVQQDSDFEKYSYDYGGPVIGYGSTYAGGYMRVGIDFERSELLEQEDLDQIQEMFEKYANKNGVKDLPLVIACREKGVLTVNNTDRIRPIIGGIDISGTYNNNATLISGFTLGYPVIKNNNSTSTLGFITVAHFLPENGTSGSIFQPIYNTSNFLASGLVNNVSVRIDALYIPFSNVEPAVHVGADPVLSNMSRTSANQSKMIIYGGSSPSGELRRFGKATGNTGGYFIGEETNFTFNGLNKSIDTVYLMNVTDGNASQPGDSGGPIYMAMNVTISGKKDYQAFMVGITNGYIYYPTNSTYVTVFTPRSEISYYLDVKPYSTQSQILT